MYLQIIATYLQKKIQTMKYFFLTKQQKLHITNVPHSIWGENGAVSFVNKESEGAQHGEKRENQAADDDTGAIRSSTFS